MKKLKLLHMACFSALALAGFTGCAISTSNHTPPPLEADGPETQCVSFTPQSGDSGSGCPGAYTGYAKMTNSTGSFWFTPPTNTVSGTLTDVSGFPDPYLSVTYVVCKKNLISWCGTNSVTFPATNSMQYSLTVYVKSTPPPPTNGQPMTLQIQWQ